MQGQAGPSWQDGADMWITCTYSSTVFEPRPERGLEDFSSNQESALFFITVSVTFLGCFAKVMIPGRSCGG